MPNWSAGIGRREPLAGWGSNQDCSKSQLSVRAVQDESAGFCDLFQTARWACRLGSLTEHPLKEGSLVGDIFCEQISLVNLTAGGSGRVSTCYVELNFPDVGVFLLTSSSLVCVGVTAGKQGIKSWMFAGLCIPLCDSFMGITFSCWFLLTTALFFFCWWRTVICRSFFLTWAPHPVLQAETHSQD